MATPAPLIDDLLLPISEENPGGEDITLAPEWHEILEARRDSRNQQGMGGDSGPGKEPDWLRVRQLASTILATKSKDLLTAVWFTESSVRINGFAGLRTGLELIRNLLERFWDTGLYPQLEDGDAEYRAKPLAWLGSDKLSDAIRSIPIAAKKDGTGDLTFLDEIESRRTRPANAFLDENGREDPDKRRAAEDAQARLREAFRAAVKSVRRVAVEDLASDFTAAQEEFRRLEDEIDQKFGKDSPSLQAGRDAFEECKNILDRLRQWKKEDEPDPVVMPSGSGTPAKPSASAAIPIEFGAGETGGSGAGSWEAAEKLLRSGDIQGGLTEMRRLASLEHGRAQFHRKLSLAEVCLATQRDVVAVAILEELNKQIDEFHLDRWESPELVARVWGRLYRCYLSEEPGSDKAGRGTLLFDRLCRLDPWQALRWHNDAK